MIASNMLMMLSIQSLFKINDFAKSVEEVDQCSVSVSMVFNEYKYKRRTNTCVSKCDLCVRTLDATNNMYKYIKQLMS